MKRYVEFLNQPLHLANHSCQTDICKNKTIAIASHFQIYKNSYCKIQDKAKSGRYPTLKQNH